MLPGQATTIRALRAFYGGKRCVVTGTVESTVDYHHLDEDNTNWIFENVVPLERGLNSAIEIHRSGSHARNKKWPRALPENLSSAFLSRVAQRNLDSGDYPGAYGCSRLGSFIAAHHERDSESAIDCATQAIYSARPTGHLCLACDSLRRSILWIARGHPHTVTKTTWAGLVKELGCYHLVYRRYQSFSEWKELGRKLLFGLEGRPNFFTKLRIDQHEGFFLLKQGKLVEATDLLEETTERMLAVSYHAGPANNLQHILAAHITSGDLERAGDILEIVETKVGGVEPLPLIEIRHGGQVYDGRSTYWTHQGLILRKADFLLKTGKEKDSLEFAQGAESIGEICGIHLAGMLPSEALQRLRRNYARRPPNKCPSCQASGEMFFQYSAELLSLLRAVV
jgi:hypothetical protein